MNMVEWVLLFAGAIMAVASLVIWFVVRRHRESAVAPASNPGLILPDAPGAVGPAMTGALVDGKAGVRDLMLSVIDLAVRGYLILKPLSGNTSSGWLLQGTDKPARGLTDFETTLLAAPAAAGAASRVVSKSVSPRDGLPVLWISQPDAGVLPSGFRTR